MLAARALLRRQPMRMLPLRRTNVVLSAAGSSATNGAPPPPTPTAKPIEEAVPGTPSLAKPVAQARNVAAAKARAKTNSGSPAATATATATATNGQNGQNGKGRTRKTTKKKSKLAQKGAAYTRALAARRTRWRPPLAPGVLPVYDLAQRYISRDAARLRGELGRVRSALSEAEAEAEGEERDEGEIRKLREKARVLAVQSEVNRPVVRWMAFSGRADLKRPVYRHLLEQKWRNHGSLDLLMERLHQMHVVPDVLPALHPSVDLQVAFPEAPPRSVVARTRRARKYKTVEPGVFLLPEQTRRPPRMTVTVFHPETRYYTLLLVDPDMPDPAQRGFTTYLHWLQPNIALRAGKTVLQPHPHTGYVPPHPQRGTPAHRYTLLLLPHTHAEPIRVPHIAEDARQGFDVRAFCTAHGLDAAQGGGAHMWRAEWDGTVSDIYRHTLKAAEPWYGYASKLGGTAAGVGGEGS